MIRRLLFSVSLFPLAALAQIQLFQYNSGAETPVGPIFSVGTAAPNDTIETRFRVHNTGAGPATLQTLSMAGFGFLIVDAPALPYIIAPGSEVEFRVDFTPTSPGTYNGFLYVNTIAVNLQGTSAPAAVLTQAGNPSPLAAGASINFGSVVVGQSQALNFTLTNANTASLTVGTLTVTGTGFVGPTGLAAPVQLAPGQTASFQVAFLPQSGQQTQGTLQLDQRTFTLTGLGLDPPLPSASITFASTLGASAQQNSVSIPLASPSQVSGSGTLTMQFQSGVPGVADDPAIQFLSGPLRTASVTIAAGDSVAKFNGQPSLAFQTGTTAGTIVFTLTLPNSTQQTNLTIAPALVAIDVATADRLTDQVDVSIQGFDNTYSASQLVFTFYNKNGALVLPGAIPVNATSVFTSYFASSTIGGAFALLASFPATGDLTQLASFTVGITNSAGVATTQQISF